MSLLRRSIAAIIAVSLTSCSSAKIKDEAYEPSRELLKAKSDAPVVALWNRWDEGGQGQFSLGGEELIGKQLLPAALADDPDAGVHAALSRAGRWETVSDWGLAGFTLAAIVAGVGYSKGSSGERALATPTINVLWLISGTGLAAALLGSSMHDREIANAVSLHNDRLWDAPRAQSPAPGAGVSVQFAWGTR